MSTVNVDVSNPDIFEPSSFRLATPGQKVLEIANDLKLEPCKEPSENSIVKIELRIIDDGDEKGIKVFDQIIVWPEGASLSEKQKKGQTINQQRLVHLTMASEVKTKEELAVDGSIPLENFKGRAVKAYVGVTTYKNQNGEDVKKNVISRYLFKKGATTE